LSYLILWLILSVQKLSIFSNWRVCHTHLLYCNQVTQMLISWQCCTFVWWNNTWQMRWLLSSVLQLLLGFQLP
jgi:hypothetical protein